MGGVCVAVIDEDFTSLSSCWHGVRTSQSSIRGQHSLVGELQGLTVVSVVPVNVCMLSSSQNSTACLRPPCSHMLIADRMRARPPLFRVVDLLVS